MEEFNFNFNKDFPSVKRIEKRIFDLELAITYTKHTVRLKQNKKKLIQLHRELDNTILQCNKFNLFNYMQVIIDKEIEKGLQEQFNKFTSISNVLNANKFYIN